MNSRKSGDKFEFTIINYLEKKNITCYDQFTQNKKDKLLNKCASTLEIDLQLDKFYDAYLHNKNLNTYKLASDIDGQQCKSADIILYDDENNIYPISCKYNNISIKHQRPSSLYKQLALSESLSLLFKKEYNDCISSIYNNLKIYKKFLDLPKNLKNNLYSQIIDLVYQYLVKISLVSTNVYRFYNFLISTDTIIIGYDFRKKNLNIYELKNLDIPTQFIINKRKSNYLDIEFNNGIKISMRLHNASSIISKNISLKFDTKILNMDVLFKKTTIR